VSRYVIKVNTAGSWANLVSCPPDRLDAVKDACARLAAILDAVKDACARLAAILDHGIAFKVIDAATEKVVAHFNTRPRAGEPHGWYSIQ